VDIPGEGESGTNRDRDQDHPHGKEMQKSKMAVWGGLKIAVKRREAKSKGERKDINI